MLARNYYGFAVIIIIAKLIIWGARNIVCWFTSQRTGGKK